MAHLADFGRRHVAEDIPVEITMSAAIAPLAGTQPRFHQAAAGIRNDQPYALEAAIDDVP